MPQLAPEDMQDVQSLMDEFRRALSSLGDESASIEFIYTLQKPPASRLHSCKEELRVMNRKLLKNLVTAAVLSVGLAAADSPSSIDLESFKVTHEIRMYPRYSIYDNISFRVTNGNVELNSESEPALQEIRDREYRGHHPRRHQRDESLQVLTALPYG